MVEFLICLRQDDVLEWLHSKSEANKRQLRETLVPSSFKYSSW